MASHPTKIGKYNVESVIGRGGMGVVYKAVDSQIGRYVAIKMILSGGDQSLLERFRSEARSTGSLQCPNIVTVYDYGEQDGNPYLVMQYLEGTSLETMLQKGVQLSLSERLGIIVDVCNGLAYAHQRGVIHRDIKPANIIVLQDGVNDGMAMIVDFGIARIAGDATRLTKTDQIIGSVHYMSPEQLQAKELDNRTDIYATGVVLFQLLTGVLPFEAPDTAATLLKIVNDPPPPLSAYVKEYPAELEGVVNRALAKKREDRYASAKELGLDLMHVQERLKSESVVQFIRRAESALGREEWTKAREQLQQVLRIDRQNTHAQKLMNTVQERMRQRQQIEQARALRSQADEAYMDQRYDDALRLLDQAVTLDPNNTDLHTLRESVRLSKERATGLRRALRRAEAALQDGDLDEAQSAVSEAFKIDPEDTQAKALKVIISQHAEERVRQEQLQKLLDHARNQIAARDLSAALVTLKEAEALDPTSNELRSVAKLALTVREQDRRRAETEELRKQIEAALVREDYATAVAMTEEGLRKFPQEQSLLKLKALAEGQRTRIEVKRFVREQFAGASSLAEGGQLVEAVAALDRALQRVPGNSELETLRSTLQERLAAEESERQKWQAMDATLAETRRILQERGARSAREFLEMHAASYAGAPQIRELYDTVRAREALEVLDARLAREANPARRVRMAEEACQANPDNAWIRQRLADLQQVKAQVSDVMERARRLEAEGRLPDAIREWQQLARAYPQLTEFQSEANRLQNLQASGLKAETPPATPSAVPRAPQKDRSEASLSATVMLDSRAVPEGHVAPPPIGVPNAPPPTPPAKIAARGEQGIPPVGTAERAPLAKRLGAGAGKSLGAGAEVARTLRRAVGPDVGQQLWQKLTAFGTRLRPLAVRSRVYWVAGAAAVLLFAFIGWRFSHRVRPHPVLPTIATQIRTSPEGAKIRVNSQDRGISNLRLDLEPGDYQVEVSLSGYQTASTNISLKPGAPAPDLDFTLQPMPQVVRITTPDLPTGEVWLDDKSAGKLESGSLTLSNFANGQHILRISTPKPAKENARIRFEIAAGAMPVVTSPLDIHEMQAVLVSTKPGSAHVVSSLGTVAVAVDGTPSGQLSAGSTDIGNLAPGVHELALGQGTDLRKLSFEVGPVPALDAIVYSDRAVGSMLVLTGEDDVQVFLDGRSLAKRTQHGELRIPNLATTAHVVAVVKDGFKEPETQKVEIVKGQEARVQFKLVQLPKLAALVVEQIPAGTQVSLDDAPIGAVGPDGALSHSGISPGDHTLVLTRPGYQVNRLSRKFSAGDTQKLSGADVVWKRATATLDVIVAAETSVTVTRGNQTVGHFKGPNKLSLDEGSYTVTTRGPNGSGSSQAVSLTAGETRTLDVRSSISNSMDLWSEKWARHDQWYQHRGGGFVLYNAPRLEGNIMFTAKLRRGHVIFSTGQKLKWVVGFVDDKNYLLFQLDNKYFYRTQVQDGNKQELPKIPHNIPGDTEYVNLSIQISPRGILQRYSLPDNTWKTLDNWDNSATTPSMYKGKPRSFSEGKFGFYLPGKDEVELSNFSFVSQAGH